MNTITFGNYLKLLWDYLTKGTEINLASCLKDLIGYEVPYLPTPAMPCQSIFFISGSLDGAFFLKGNAPLIRHQLKFKTIDYGLRDR